jgi:thiamine-phosphate pyrophosphorylase
MLRLPACGLYAITDGPRADLLDAVEAALRGGCRVLQYRDKTVDAVRREHEALELLALCTRYAVPLIINDDADLAACVGAAGVHLGEDDANIASARATIGPTAIVGVSCYDSLSRAQELAAAGADYLAFGAFFPSSSKATSRRASPNLLREAAVLGKPRVAIGGITVDNAPLLIDAGADFLAVISGVFAQPDPHGAAARYAALFPPFHRADP